MKNFNQYAQDAYACHLLESLANNNKIDKSEYDAVLEMLLSLYNLDNQLIIETLISLQDDESYLAESFSTYDLPLLEMFDPPLPLDPRRPSSLLDKIDRVKNIVMYGRKATQEIEHIKNNLHKATPEQAAAGQTDGEPLMSYQERKKAFKVHFDHLQGRQSPWARKHEDQPKLQSITKLVAREIVNKIRS